MDEHTVTLTYREYAMFLDKLTVRDRFAMAALTGMIADPNGPDYRSVPKKAYEMADAMLEARKEKK